MNRFSTHAHLRSRRWWRSVTSVLFGLFFVVGLGCSDDPGGSTTTVAREMPENNLKLSAAALSSSDVGEMAFTVSACGDTSPVETATQGLEPITLPGGIEVFENKPYDEDSKHAFADRYFLLDAGCYDVQTQPLKADGSPSDDCTGAERKGVEVVDGKTTEILLINQCKGPERGGLDVIGSINHPPQIDALEFFPSKFTSCPQPVRICATISDPDGDPLRTSWDVQAGPTPGTLPTVAESNYSDGTLRECVDFETGRGGAWTLGVEAFDQVHHEGQLIDVEVYHGQVQGAVRESRDTLVFPVYSAPCDDTDAGHDFDAGQPQPDAGFDDVYEEDASDDDAGSPDGPVVCTRTRGYWQTHHESATAPGLQLDWPAPRDESDQLCGQNWIDILHTEPQGNAWYILASQWIASELNVANGAPRDAWTSWQANTGLGILESNCSTIVSGDADHGQAIYLAGQLDQYNHGQKETPKCN